MFRKYKKKPIGARQGKNKKKWFRAKNKFNRPSSNFI